MFPPYSTIGPAKSISSFFNEGDASEDLLTLVGMLADRSLTVEIGWRGPWEQFTEAVETIQGRRLTGKAVLDIGT